MDNFHHVDDKDGEDGEDDEDDENLSKDESYLVMKVMIVKEVMTGDVSPVVMFLGFR